MTQRRRNIYWLGNEEKRGVVHGARFAPLMVGDGEPDVMLFY